MIWIETQDGLLIKVNDKVNKIYLEKYDYGWEIYIKYENKEIEMLGHYPTYSRCVKILDAWKNFLLDFYFHLTLKEYTNSIFEMPEE